MATPKKILVPVDFGETSTLALDHALAWAKAFGASVTALYAYELPVYGFPDGFLVASEMTPRILEGSEKAMKDLVERYRSSGVPFNTEIRQGPASDEVVAFAKDGAYDLIVMSTHGRKGVSRLLLGSVAEKVIRSASCPVLTVRPKD